MIPHIPWGLIVAALAIAALGIWNLASASRPPHTPLWTRQSLNLAVGLAVALGICLVDYRVVQRAVVPIYVLNIAALMLLRDIAMRGKDGLLDRVNLMIVPIFNADGHARSGAFNRPN